MQNRLSKVQNKPVNSIDNTNQLKFLLDSVVNKLWKHPFSWPFQQPVNAVKLKLSHYHKIIKFPIDLGSIKEKLENEYYSNAEDAIKDLCLMFLNCIIFNDNNDDVVIMAKKLIKTFTAAISKMPKIEVSSKNNKEKSERRDSMVFIPLAVANEYHVLDNSTADPKLIEPRKRKSSAAEQLSSTFKIPRTSKQQVNLTLV